MKGTYLGDFSEDERDPTVTEQDEVEELWQKAKKLYGGTGQDSPVAGSAAGAPTDDEFMAAFELAQTGELPAPAGEAVDLSDSAATDEELWQSYVELQDGTASKRRALENARREEREREEEWLSHYRTSGTPLRRDHEYLRPQLREHGY